MSANFCKISDDGKSGFKITYRIGSEETKEISFPAHELDMLSKDINHLSDPQRIALRAVYGYLNQLLTTTVPDISKLF